MSGAVKQSRKKHRTGLTVAGITDWAESQSPQPTAAAPPAQVPRHAPGRGSELTPDEIDQIRLEHLCHQLNRVQLAERFGRTRNTISNCLKGEDFEALRRTFDCEIRDEIKRRMVAKASKAADSWELSMGVAADRGDHRPSKDWLMHAGVIDPIDAIETGPKVIVQIGCRAEDVKIGIRADGSAITFADADTGRCPTPGAARV